MKVKLIDFKDLYPDGRAPIHDFAVIGPRAMMTARSAPSSSPKSKASAIAGSAAAPICGPARAGCFWVAEDLCSACTRAPGYWMHETSGVLQPAVMAYLEGKPLSVEDIATLKAYCRHWIMTPVWAGPTIDELRAGVDGLTSREAIERWMDLAIEEGVDPL